MKEFCQNEHCENPGANVVPVSVERASDQRRTLCRPCEEAYTWGVQHGTLVAQVRPALPRLTRFLKKDGFVILSHNDHDPSAAGPFEAWAYRGPLDLRVATPVTFGVGNGVQDALDSLEAQLEATCRHVDLREETHDLDGRAVS
ncbi:MAG: hypothetical protein NTV86_04845 [Planctomycetota bacterium]|nr:hypothetical protein [Planctomycetota bacterium]